MPNAPTRKTACTCEGHPKQVVTSVPESAAIEALGQVLPKAGEYPIYHIRDDRHRLTTVSHHRLDAPHR